MISRSQYEFLWQQILALKKRLAGVATTGGTVGGGGDVSGPGTSTDNAIARWNGTAGDTLQDSTPLVEDDGRISTLTDPSGAQDAATKNYVDAQISGAPPLTGGFYTAIHRPGKCCDWRGCIRK